MESVERITDDGPPLGDIVERIKRGESFALAVVMKADGSTPREAGTMALMDERGAITGTIGGGQLEAEAQRHAVQTIRDRVPVVFDFTYQGASAAERDPICGGQMRVLVFFVERGHHDAFRAAEQAWLRRELGALTIRFVDGEKAAVRVEFVAAQTHGGEAVSSSPGDSIVVPLIPPARLLIFGGGHVGQALARQASLLGFDITVIDDRPEFAAPGRFPPEVTTICATMDEAAGSLPMDENTFVAIVTRGHSQDTSVLARCIHRPVAYLGMMGSRRKVALVRDEFTRSGLATAQEFDRVHAPIGLELGAETVPEIAASIVAQLVAVRRKKSVPPTQEIAQS